ncbi:MAG: flippase-like domain-containing protein, partial [Chloroflexi bacterium]|nr:flippase-like domain-containing protein [Chloroflexota bacterium]
MQQEGDNAGRSISLKRRFLQPRTFIALVLALGLLAFVFTRFDVDLSVTWQQVLDADPLFLLLGFAIYYASFPLRGLRWGMLLRNAGLRNEGKGLPSTAVLTEMVLLNWFANVILFARVGDIYRPYLLKEERDIPYARSLGTVLAERILDILVVVALLAAAALVLVGGMGRAVGAGYLLLGLGLVALMLTGLAVLWRFGAPIERLLPARLRPAWCAFRECTFGSFRQVPLLVLITTVVWLAEVGRLYFVLMALGLAVPLSFVFFVALAYAVAVALPTTPGGLGIVEGGMAGLLSFTVSSSAAWSATILDRSITFLSLIVVGLGIFGWREARRL